MPSSIDPSIAPLAPPRTTTSENPTTEALIQNLNLIRHVEGGYFAEIDRNPLLIANPFLPQTSLPEATNTEGDGAAKTAILPRSGDDTIRNASTSIYYLLTRGSAWGSFHRNRGRTVHTLVRGRGRYVVVHGDEEGWAGDGEQEGGRGEQEGGGIRIETFVVGMGVERGERSVWVVEGGKWKASLLVDDGEGEGEGLLISETVIPGFEYSDHDFLTRERFEEIFTEEQQRELEWLVRKGDAPVLEELR